MDILFAREPGLMVLHLCVIETCNNRLAGGETKETTLLQHPHELPEEDDDDAFDMGAMLSKGSSKAREDDDDDDI